MKCCFPSSTYESNTFIFLNLTFFRQYLRYISKKRLKVHQSPRSFPDISSTISDESEDNVTEDDLDITCNQSFTSIHEKSILNFETKMSKVMPDYCKVCFRCSLDLKVNKDKICQICQKAKIDPINNNILPIWYNNDVPQTTVPEELSCLRLAEKMLLQLVSPFVPQQYINNGTFGIKGHVCCFPQDIGEVATVLPRLPSNIKMIKLVRQVTSTVGGPKTDKTFKVRRYETLRALLWLKRYNVLYRDVIIDSTHLGWMRETNEADITPHILEIQRQQPDDKSRDDSGSNNHDQLENMDESKSLSQLDVLDDLGPSPAQVLEPRVNSREEY